MIEVERMTPEGWERVRAIRLRALADAPDAFATTLTEDEARSAEGWRERLASRRVVTFLATRAGSDLGLVVGAPWSERPGCAGLFAMWVAPEARGSGAADLLVVTLIDWARSEGYARLLLEVADDNPRAIALYARHGFEPNGVRGTLPPPRTHVSEHQRVLELGEP